MSKALTALAPAGAVGLSLLAAVCGGSAGNGVARVGSTPATTSDSDSSGPRSARGGPDALVALTACMRKHGVPNFPDPKADIDGYHLRYGPENGIDLKSPQSKNAEQACKRRLPNGATPSPQEHEAQLEDALKFAACVGSHGVPTFLDAKLSGNGRLEMSPGARSSVNTGSSRFKAAETACQHLLPGSGGGTSTSGSGEAP
jgi:hypothetical protein